MPKIWSRIQMSSRNKDNPRIGQQQTILRQCSVSANQSERVAVEVVVKAIGFFSPRFLVDPGSIEQRGLVWGVFLPH
jgi:hypothetical protein